MGTVHFLPTVTSIRAGVRFNRNRPALVAFALAVLLAAAIIGAALGTPTPVALAHAHGR